jgi:hypothetical protein
MSTLGEMKTRIAEETTRDDLLASGAIEREIVSAMKFYRSNRFWFNESRSKVQFNTVVGQSTYTAAAHPDIPDLLRIDYITVSYLGRELRLRFANPADMEQWTGSIAAVTNPPAFFSYYGQELRFYPIPDGVYPVRVAGVTRYPLPAFEAETGNPWMTDAAELIAARATRNLYLKNMFGSEQSQVAAFKALEDEALERLRVETSSRSQVRTMRSHSL